jgi:hypothetical protein
MNQKEMGELVCPQISWDGVHHSRSMNNRVEPKGPRHLFLREVHSQHVDHNLPMQSYETISQLSTCHRHNYFRVVVNEMLMDFGAKKFGVAVRKKHHA